MRILQVHSRHATRGGADHVVDREGLLLTDAGHQVRQHFAPSVEQAGLSRVQAGAAAVWNQQTVRDVRREIDDFAPDVVHVHTPFPVLSPSVFWAAHRHRLPVLVTAHSYRFSCIAGTMRRDGVICEDCVGTKLRTPGVRHGCYHGSSAASAAMAASLVLHRAALDRHVDRYLTMTDFARDLFIRDGVEPDRVTVKPNCMDDPGPPVPADQREPFVLFVGRLVPEKGVHTLVNAWLRLRPRGVRLVVCGDGPLRAELTSAAAHRAGIEFRGWVSEADVVAAQREARLTVVPSEWYEAGPPLVLLQALACGTPSVMCDLANVSASVAATGAGSTFRTGDAEDLARVLGQALADDPASASFAARELYLRDHTPESSLKTLETVYAELTERRSR